MSAKISKDDSTGYKLTAGTINFDEKHVIKNTHVPADPNDIPTILGWSGPARSGSTALLFLMCGNPGVDRAYFQPQKTLMRKGSPAFELYAGDRIICMKEVFGQLHPQENYDPVEMLLAAGVPKEKIVWISLLREPSQTLASWHHSKADILQEAQEHTLKQYFRNKEMGIRTIPFVYELLENNEQKALSVLLEKTGLGLESPSLIFDEDAISRKLVPGQAAEEAFFKSHIKRTLDRRQFVYSRNDFWLSSAARKKVAEMCMPTYLQFYEVAKKEFGL